MAHTSGRVRLPFSVLIRIYAVESVCDPHSLMLGETGFKVPRRWGILSSYSPPNWGLKGGQITPLISNANFRS